MFTKIVKFNQKIEVMQSAMSRRFGNTWVHLGFQISKAFILF